MLIGEVTGTVKLVVLKAGDDEDNDEEGHLEMVINHHRGCGITCIDAAHNGRIVSILDTQGRLSVWSHSPQQPLLKLLDLATFGSDLISLARVTFIQNEVLLYSNHSKKLICYDYVAKRVRNTIAMDKISDVTSLDLSPDRKLACVGTANRLTRLVDCMTYEFVDVVAHTTPITCVRFSPDNRFLISCAKNELLVWNVL